MIDSKLKLIKYIRSMLGEPLVKVEITDFQISEIIDNVVQKFTEYAYGDLEAIVKLNLDGAKTYQLPEAITNIIQLSKGSSGNITDFGTNYGKGTSNEQLMLDNGWLPVYDCGQAVYEFR